MSVVRRVAEGFLGLGTHTLGAVAVVVAGAGMAFAALTGRLPIAGALLAALLTALLLLLVRLDRRTTDLHHAQQRSIGDLREITEQVQRRAIAAVEKQRLEAGDRHLELTDAIARADRLTPEGAEALLHAQNREIEAVVQLSRVVAPRAPLPAAESGPSPTDVLGLLHLVHSRKPGLTVALGAGPATIWLGYATEPAGRLVVVDHDAARADGARADLAAHGLTAVEVRHAPPVELTVDGRTTDWYDVDALDGLHGIDLLIVDGPAADPLPAALHVLGRRLAAGAVVVAATRAGVPRQGGVDGFRAERPPAGRWTVLSPA